MKKFCKEIDKIYNQTLDSKSFSIELLSPEALRHIQNCKRCFDKYSVQLAASTSAELAKQITPSREAEFFSLLEGLGKEKENPIIREKTAEEYIREGDQFFAIENYRRAERKYYEALMLQPAHPEGKSLRIQREVEILRKLARTLYARNRFLESLKNYEQLLQLFFPDFELNLPTFQAKTNPLLKWGDKIKDFFFSSKYEESLPPELKQINLQPIYREIGIVAEGFLPKLVEWAEKKELDLASKNTDDQLENLITKGRFISKQARRGNTSQAQRQIKKYRQLPADSLEEDLIKEFYLAQTHYFLREYPDARELFTQLLNKTPSKYFYLLSAQFRYLFQIELNTGNTEKAFLTADSYLKESYRKFSPLQMSIASKIISELFKALGDRERTSVWENVVEKLKELLPRHIQLDKFVKKIEPNSIKNLQKTPELPFGENKFLSALNRFLERDNLTILFNLAKTKRQHHTFHPIETLDIITGKIPM